MPDGLALAAIALLLLGKKKPGGSAASSPAAAAAGATTDGGKLLSRAHQAPAQAWLPIFMDAGATPAEAAAMTRWAGLESSGNPRPMPPGNGGGLMQVGRGFVDMGAMTTTEHARLTNPATSNKEQAVLALKYVRWCADQAARLLSPLALGNDTDDRMWWGYSYHQRPVDVRDVYAPHARQFSSANARYLADVLGSLLKDANALHRLRASNVVAFDAPGGA